MANQAPVMRVRSTPTQAIRILLLFVIVTLTQMACGGIPAAPSCGSAVSCTRVLFVGNSYTYVNDLPATFALLSGSGGHPVATGTDAQGGAMLTDHAASASTTSTLKSAKWNVVVLQEQSQGPSIESFRQRRMYPAARRLVTQIRGVGAQPMFFLAWARRDGSPENGIPDYATMQARVDQGYLAIAHEQGAPVAPVGYAWQTLLAQTKPSDLWQTDGVHPTSRGTYLAACVFYAAIFRESPKGLTYHGDLSDADAATVQRIASDTVLGDPEKWGLR
jgi:hypothetical protein